MEPGYEWTASVWAYGPTHPGETVIRAVHRLASPRLVIKCPDKLVRDGHPFDSRLGHDHKRKAARRVHREARPVNPAPAVCSPRLARLRQSRVGHYRDAVPEII